jgi:hypothetical protein
MKTQDLKIIRISANSSYYIKNDIDRGGLGANIGFKSFNAHYFTLTTRANFNATYTTSTINDKIECFTYMPLSASLSSSAYRIFHLGSIKLKHTISPTISFSYNEPLFIPDSENFIVGNSLSYFETATKGLNFALNNRFSLKDGNGQIKNIGQLNLSGNYDFKLKKIPAINGYATFIPLHLNLRAGYSFLTEKITSCNLSFNKTFPNGFSLYSSLSYYTQFVQTMRLSYKCKNLTLMTNLSYNYYGHNIMKRFNKRELSVNFPLHCFNLRFLYQLQYYGDLPTLNKFLFTISIGKVSGSDLKIESDFKNKVLSILGNREPMPM